MHVGIAYLRWRETRSRHSRRMRTHNFTHLARGPLKVHCITSIFKDGQPYDIPSVNHDALQWRHNEDDGVSNHRRLDCLLIRSFRRRSKKTSKLRVTGLCEGNPPVTSRFPFDDVIMDYGYATWSQEAKNVLECSKMATATNLSHCFRWAFA